MNNIEHILKKIESTPDFFGHTINSVNYRNGYGDTPLHILGNWGDCDSIKALIEAGANINAIGEAGFTPLHCASEQNHPEAISLLIAYGAKSLSDENGLTPLKLAELLENNEAVKSLKQAFNK
ncbi:ankyrin repeat domain-containing protein [Parendozoicomonas haliclonae]|uniref:Ankyrin repeats (3 copies) n=1 Tax=Parendozoicomonas haliclonae TaxID=1960125 RepID=A0A1X7ARV2_9GAMM|nr:ankyrin repeat domain-containing protein [Parendozoicomonas haliclonae]SMA50810.1 Ankyrin repeats (3 copies) [Parendozoicomonas haliclonae]